MSEQVPVEDDNTPRAPPVEAPNRKRPNWLSKIGHILASPITNLWSKDIAFHTRLTSFAGILAVLAAVVVPVAIAANASPQPVVAAPASTPKTQIQNSKAQPCSADATNGIRSCALGRTSSVWSRSVKVGTTSVFSVELYYENVSMTQQRNVVVRVQVPDNLKYLDGTTFLYTSDGTQSVADGIAKGGLIIGGFLPSGDAYIKFSVVAADTSSLACGENVRVINFVTVTSGGSRNAGLPITISKTC